jgi:hypothetical protein
LIITAGGENVPPSLIEDNMKGEMEALSNCMVIGDKRKYLAMLITLKTEVYIYICVYVLTHVCSFKYLAMLIMLETEVKGYEQLHIYVRVYVCVCMCMCMKYVYVNRNIHY